MIRLESLNVGFAEPLVMGDRAVESGIRKLPTPYADLSRDGFSGDAQADMKHHGGPDQAAYVYRTEDYTWWAEQLGRTLEPGIFGENLTVSGLPNEVRIGDRLTLGAVLLEVSAPRIPCNKLAARMSDPGFVKTFQRAERPGFYTRVLRAGRVTIGDAVAYTPNPDAAPKVPETFRWFYEKNPDPSALRKALSAPLGVRLRRHFVTKLER